MSKGKNKRLITGIGIVLMLFCMASCRKEIAMQDEAKIKPPIRTYIVTARIDKKGTNTNSEGTAVLKGSYDENTKELKYTVEYQNCIPEVIALRSGPKGSAGSLIKELYRKDAESTPAGPLTGALKLSPLQERNLLKGQWFVAVSTILMSPEISGVLTLKQK